MDSLLEYHLGTRKTNKISDYLCLGWRGQKAQQADDEGDRKSDAARLEQEAGGGHDDAVTAASADWSLIRQRLASKTKQSNACAVGRGAFIYLVGHV